MHNPEIENPLPERVEARLRYIVAGEKAVFYPTDREKSYWPAEEHTVAMKSMRPSADRCHWKRTVLY